MQCKSNYNGHGKDHGPDACYINGLITIVCIAVNGGWSIWSEYSPCSVTCGSGTKVRMRTCTNPIPENNGAECTGVRVETQSCDMGPCSGGFHNLGPVYTNPG